MKLKIKLICAAILFTMNTSAYSDVEKTGDILQIVVPASGLLAAFYLDDDEGKTQFYKSFATTFLITHGLKNTVKKRRPDSNNRESFPSGHTSSAFQGAAFIQKRYGWNYGVPAYIAAAYVGYSRVDTRHHDNADVLMGAMIGVLSSYYFTTEYKNIDLKPVVLGDQYGIDLSMRW